MQNAENNQKRHKLCQTPEYENECLIFRNDTDTPCLSLFHGIRLILEANNRLGISRGFSELHPGEPQDHSMEQETEKDYTQGNPLLRVQAPQKNNSPCEFREPLQQLRYLVFNKFPTDNPRHSSYCYAFEMLCSRFESILGAGISGQVVQSFQLVSEFP